MNATGKCPVITLLIVLNGHPDPYLDGPIAYSEAKSITTVAPTPSCSGKAALAKTHQVEQSHHQHWFKNSGVLQNTIRQIKSSNSFMFVLLFPPFISFPVGSDTDRS